MLRRMIIINNKEGRIFNKTRCVLVFTALTLGCSSTTYVLEPSSVNPFTESQLTRKISGETVTIEFNNGTTTEARDFRMGHDSCSWFEANSGVKQEARSRDIRKICTNGHFVGSMEGLGLGLLAGVLIPFAVVPAGKQGGDVPLGGLAVLVGMAVGGPLGATCGAIVGHSYEYEFVWLIRKRDTDCTLVHSGESGYGFNPMIVAQRYLDKRNTKDYDADSVNVKVVDGEYWVRFKLKSHDTSNE
ncbi:MAG: hypothetical protein WBD36_10935, partial [Bacteroidota bacterium]